MDHETGRATDVTAARVPGVPEPGREQASWRLFADLVRAATGYE